MKWPQLNVRLEPSLHAALVAALSSPLYLQLPKGEVQTFVNTAIRNELRLRGFKCDILSSTSSTSKSGPLPESWSD